MFVALMHTRYGMPVFAQSDAPITIFLYDMEGEHDTVHKIVIDKNKKVRIIEITLNEYEDIRRNIDEEIPQVSTDNSGGNETISS